MDFLGSVRPDFAPENPDEIVASYGSVESFAEWKIKTDKISY
jgi:hypothetical protein